MAFTPQLFSGLQSQGLPPVTQIEAMPQEVPIAQPIPVAAQPQPPQQVFIPVPIMVPEKKPKKMLVSPEAVRKAQGIYPIEKQAKAEMINNAKTPPTPTGAWGAPE